MTISLWSPAVLAQGKLPAVGTVASYQCWGGLGELRESQIWTQSSIGMTVLDAWGETEVSQDFQLWQYLAQIPGEYHTGKEFLRVTRASPQLESVKDLKIGRLQGEIELMGLEGRESYSVELVVGDQISKSTALGQEEVIPITSTVKAKTKTISTSKVFYSRTHRMNLVEERNGDFGKYKCEIRSLKPAGGLKLAPTTLRFVKKEHRLTYRCRGDLRAMEIMVHENLGSTVILTEKIDEVDQPKKTTNEQLFYAGVATQIQIPGESPLIPSIAGEKFFQAPGVLEREVYRGSVKVGERKHYVRVEVRPTKLIGTANWGKIEVEPIVSYSVSSGQLTRRSYLVSTTHLAPLRVESTDFASKKSWDCELDAVAPFTQSKDLPPMPNNLSK